MALPPNRAVHHPGANRDQHQEERAQPLGEAATPEVAIKCPAAGRDGVMESRVLDR